MRATFTDEQQQLRSAARDLASAGREAARSALEGEAIPEEPTASLLSGFSGLAVPEDDGGAGGDLIDLAIVLEALGTQVTPTPWVSHVLAVQAAHTAGLDVASAAAGERRLALAVDESEHGQRWSTTLTDGRLKGTKVAVPEGGDADAVVVLAGDDTVAIAVPSGRTLREPLDRTRAIADLTFDGEPEAHAPGADAAYLRINAALAAELVGVGRGAVDLAVEYAKVREQFGQAIGRFQGVAHQIADAWTSVELAWSLTLFACWAVAADAPEARRSVHAARAEAGDAAIHAAERCTQVHGGIGITWEADPHLYLRRALATDAWAGPGSTHRRLLGDLLVGG